MGISYNTSIVRNGLVLYLDAANPKSYPGSGTLWKDLSGNGNDGTLVNGVGYSSDNKGSMVFDGMNDYVNTASIQFDRLLPFTLSAVINSNNATNNQIINNENDTYRGYLLSVDTDSLLFFSNRSNTSNRIHVKTNNTLNIDTWYHVAATYDGSSDVSGVKLYVNSVVQETIIVANNLTGTTISGQTTWIGGRRPNTPGFLNGSVATAVIYNRVLSPEEIRQNYEATRGRYGI